MDAIHSLFAAKVLPRVAKLGASEISCRVIVPGVGEWRLGSAPARSELEITGDALLTLRSTPARDAASLVRSGHVKVKDDEVHALQTLAFLTQSDLCFGPEAAFQARPPFPVSQFALFAAPREALGQGFPGWLPPAAAPEGPRPAVVRDPFTGRREARRRAEAAPRAAYVPCEPPFPFVELPLDYHYPADMLLLYGRISEWSEAEFPKCLEDVEPHFERLFAPTLSNGGDPSAEGLVQVLSVAPGFRARLSAMPESAWAASVSLLSLEEPGVFGPFLSIFYPLQGLARGAEARGEDLWLFARA